MKVIYLCDAKKKQIEETDRHCKRGCGTTENSVKYRNRESAKFNQKTHEEMRKTIVKNKASSLIHIQSQNAKKQSSKYARNCTQYT